MLVDADTRAIVQIRSILLEKIVGRKSRVGQVGLRQGSGLARWICIVVGGELRRNSVVLEILVSVEIGVSRVKRGMKTGGFAVLAVRTVGNAGSGH